MGKIKVSIDSKEKSTFKIGDAYVEVIPYLTVSTQSALISKYISDMYSDEGENLIDNVGVRRMNAEISQMLYIIQSNTNIEAKSVNEDLFFSSKYWKQITERIDNYNDFREMQDKIVSDYEKQLNREASAGFVLSNLIEKVSLFVDKIGDITPESIEALQQTGVELIERLEKSNVVKDMERGSK